MPRDEQVSRVAARFGGLGSSEEGDQSQVFGKEIFGQVFIKGYLPTFPPVRRMKSEISQGFFSLRKIQAYTPRIQSSPLN